MKWTTEKKATWIKTRLAFGPIYTRRVQRADDVGWSNYKAGSTGFQKMWGISVGVLVVNKKGQLIHKVRTPRSRHADVVWRCCSLIAAVRFVKLYDDRVLDPAGTQTTVNLQTRGVLPDHVVDILFDRLREQGYH